MKKIFTVFILLILAIALFGCTKGDFTELNVVAADVADIEPGEYNLIYTIPNLQKYQEKYPDLTVSVSVVDEKNARVEVKNNRVITVEKDRTYTVIVTVTATVDGTIAKKTKQFAIIAVKTDPVVTLLVNNTFYKRYDELSYGDTLDISQIPDVPNFIPSDDGYDRTIIAKKWSTAKRDRSRDYYDNLSQSEYDNLSELTQEDLTDITKSMNIYARYLYSKTPKTFTINFHNNGGSETAAISLPYLSNLNCPSYPTKDNYIFDGWYTDENLTDKFNWRMHLSITNNYELYAKWIPATDAAINSLYSYEEKDDGYGYKYYLVKPASAMVGVVTLPTGNNNIPVRGFQTGAFKGMSITSVIIPKTYNNDTYEAFCDCTDLTSVTFEDGSEAYYLDTKTFYNCTSLTSISLPAGIRTIQTSCFENCTDLTSITIPNKVATISSRTFAGCTGLTSVVIPDTVSGINERAFYGCTNLNSVSISATSALTSISNNAFGNTAITAITLPYYFLENNINPFEGTSITVTYHQKNA